MVSCQDYRLRAQRDANRYADRDAGGTTPRKYRRQLRGAERLASQLRLQQKPLRPKALHDVQPVFRTDFVLHAVQVILYRLLGEAEVICDFFVREAFGDQRDKLLLAARQSKSLSWAGARKFRGFALEIAE